MNRCKPLVLIGDRLLAWTNQPSTRPFWSAHPASSKNSRVYSRTASGPPGGYGKSAPSRSVLVPYKLLNWPRGPRWVRMIGQRKCCFSSYVTDKRLSIYRNVYMTTGCSMKLTLAIKLTPSCAQHAALVAALERFNAACNAIAELAFRQHLANKIALQKIVYRDIRYRFGLSSQMTVRAIGKVVEAYKRDKAIRPTFRPHGALTYDERIMSWKCPEHVSLLALDGRHLVACHFGRYQQARRDFLRGQADLILHDGAFFLYATLEVPDVPTPDVQDFLGVD